MIAISYLPRSKTKQIIILLGNYSIETINPVCCDTIFQQRDECLCWIQNKDTNHNYSLNETYQGLLYLEEYNPGASIEQLYQMCMQKEKKTKQTKTTITKRNPDAHK